MENKNEGNENKIIFRYFNCIIDTMERDGRNKTLLFELCPVKTHRG